jgi:hypothetical protein
MTKKQIIIGLSSLLVVSYAGFFVFQRMKRKKADESVDSLQQALNKLNNAKQSSAILYAEPASVEAFEITSDSIDTTDGYFPDYQSALYSNETSDYNSLEYFETQSGLGDY